MSVSDALRRIAELEERLRQEPASERVLEAVLSAYAAEPGVWAEPRRIAHVLAYVTQFPRSGFARTPLVLFPPGDFPDAWREVEQQWLRHIQDSPNDPALARGFALFLAEVDSPRALGVLRDAVSANPSDAALYTDMGRVCLDPAKRLEYFQRAMELGGSQPNLLVWIATAAADAGQMGEAARASTELLAQAAELRALHGDRLDWQERGRLLWARAKAECSDRVAAHTLVNAMSDHANKLHWGHTIAGLVSVHQKDLDRALGHLAMSAAVVGGPRLSSYGPSFRLAAELAHLGHWGCVIDYLYACSKFWEDTRIDTWISDLRARRVPNFPDQ